MSLYLGNNLISGSKPINLGVRNIGEIVASSLPLTDAGLHLLDGSLINGSGIYSAFVDKIGDIYSTSQKYSNVIKVGSLTDNNGVLSGFSSSNYAQIERTPTNITSFEIAFKVTTGTVSGNSIIMGNYSTNRDTPQINVGSANQWWFGLGSDASTWVSISGSSVASNTTYWVKFTWNGTEIEAFISLDGVNYVSQGTAAINTCNWTASPRIGIDVLSNPWTGSIDLNESYININGQRWWTGALPSGFTDEAQWQASVTQYGVCGKFVYDATANTVRLPKITGIIEGTTDLTALGDLVEAGLPNITGQHYELTSKSDEVKTSGAFYQSSTGTNTYRGHGSDSGTYPIISFNASRSSSIYGNSSTVQPQTIKAFYYIVIATSTKTDIQVDIDEVATDLNGKVNIADCAEVQCVVETYVNGNSWYRIYSDGWCEQGGHSANVNMGTSTTVTFLKPYVNNKYSVSCEAVMVSTDDSYFKSDLSSLTTSSFTVVNRRYSGSGTDTLYYIWRAAGYIS